MKTYAHAPELVATLWTMRGPKGTTLRAVAWTHPLGWELSIYADGDDLRQSQVHRDYALLEAHAGELRAKLEEHAWSPT